MKGQGVDGTREFMISHPQAEITGGHELSKPNEPLGSATEWIQTQKGAHHSLCPCSVRSKHGVWTRVEVRPHQITTK